MPIEKADFYIIKQDIENAFKSQEYYKLNEKILIF